MLFKTLHNINTVANRNPQKAMNKLARLDKSNQIDLAGAIKSATRRGGALFNHCIGRLGDLKRQWLNAKRYNLKHYNDGLAHQDRWILSIISTYAKHHNANVWTDISLDFSRKDCVANIKPADDDTVFYLIHSVLQALNQSLN